jgi:hypothetical protein
MANGDLAIVDTVFEEPVIYAPLANDGDIKSSLH